MTIALPQAAADGVARLADLAARVSAALERFIADAEPTLTAAGPELAPVAAAVRDFVVPSGKRLRPAFCYWGWRGTGAPDDEALLRAAASLELLHACALIHDDVIDDSDTRRGRPAVHRRFAELHRSGDWNGSPGAFGRSVAVLLGDLCLVWASQMFHECGLPPAVIERAGAVYSEMRIELMAGQYLDVVASVLPPGSSAEAGDRAMRVARFKTAKYTIERPLHLGGQLAGACPELLADYSAYGLPLGEAFQLRDDVLGVFGDPAVTGKPAGDDLREGKRTLLVTLAEQRASAVQRAVLTELVGNPRLEADGVDACREIMRETGALDDVELLISRHSEEAREALRSPRIAAETRSALEALATAAAHRIG